MRSNNFGNISPRAQEFLDKNHGLLIDGGWITSASGEEIKVFNPANGGEISSVAKGGAADIDLAVNAAEKAFNNTVWRQMSAEDRAKLLWRFADLLEENIEELADLEVVDNGMIKAFAEWAVASSASWLRHFAGMTGRVVGRNTSSVVSTDGSFHSYTSMEPVGVVGFITPWNGPIASFMIKVAPALAAGCTCIVKPAEDTPITALRLGELALEAGFPAGVINIVTGCGDAGAALASHPGVNKISFTGSTNTGKRVLNAAAGNIKRVTLELGGKSPCIVFDDADLTQAIPGAAMAIFANSGQVCFAGSRLYVQRSSFDQVVEGVAKFAKSLNVGSGLDSSVQIGPLVSTNQLKRVTDYVSLGVEEGGEVVTGGRRCDRDGYFIEPTVFTNLSASSRLIREEIFGPVVVATPFDDFEEVVALANDSDYGLGSGVFTENLSTAHRMASRLRAGNVWVNCYGVMDPSMPFGGFKESGLGREMGDEGFAAFFESKSVYMKLGER